MMVTHGDDRSIAVKEAMQVRLSASIGGKEAENRHTFSDLYRPKSRTGGTSARAFVSHNLTTISLGDY